MKENDVVLVDDDDVFMDVASSLPLSLFAPGNEEATRRDVVMVLISISSSSSSSSPLSS